MIPPLHSRWLSGLLLVAFTGIATASTNSWSLRKWQMEDGLPNNTVTSLAQTPDGYLWVATPTRLARFDGARFEGIPRDAYARGATDRTSTLLRARDGGLWLAIDHGPVVHIRGDVIQAVTNRLQNDKLVQSLAEDTDTLWITYRGGAVTRVRNGQGQSTKSSEGLPGGPICSFACDIHGQSWYAKDGQFGSVRNDRFTALFSTGHVLTYLAPSHDGGIWICAGTWLSKFDGQGYPRLVGQFQLTAEPTVIIEDHNGGVWIGTADSGLFHYADGHFEQVPTSHRQILCLIEDHEGNIWVGTGGGGLDRIQRQAISLEGTEKGLPFEAVQSICEHTNGTLWAATQNGLLAFRTNDTWRTFGTNGAWTGGLVNCIAADQTGSLWIATRQHRLFRLQNSGFTVWDSNNGLASRNIHGLFVARNGDVWIGANAPDSVQRLRDGQLRTFTLPREDVRIIRAMAEDADGNIWIGTSKGFLFKVNGDQLTEESQAVMGTNHSIRALHVSSDGSLWIGLSGEGLGRYKNGRYFGITSDKGLFDNAISQVLSDNHGWLWIGSDHGIFKIREQEFDDLAAGRTDRVHSIVYGPGEGLPSLQANFDNCPSTLQTADGRLWMPMRTALAVIDPDQVRENFEPPRVLLKSVTVDDHVVAAYGNPMTVSNVVDLQNAKTIFRLPPGHHRLQFEYTGLDFNAPESVTFRYRLDGYDDRWMDNGAQHVTSYSRLPAGAYRFRVTAGNRDGFWNETGAVVGFVVEPFFWQRFWFQATTLAVLIATVVAIVRYVSFRRLRFRLQRLEQQAALDRERARIAKDIHDDLGGSLTHVALLVKMLGQQRNQPDKIDESARQLSTTVRHVNESLDEIVWAVNPRNDTLPHLVDFLCEFAAEFLQAANVKCRVDVPAGLPPHTVTPEQRHNLLLAVKEALNNIVRHAGAGEVWLRFRLEGSMVRVAVEDNGRGLNGAPDRAGADGLRNMRQRMEAIEGDCAIENISEGGTRISFSFPVLKQPPC